MQTPGRQTLSYSLTLRIEYPNSVGMLGRVTSAIGQNGGDLGAIDIVKTARGTITRDITFAAAGDEHGQQIIAAVRAIDGVDVVNVSDRTFLLHLGGVLEINGRVPVKTRDDLSMVYVPGVARIAQAIANDPADAFNLTIKKHAVAIVTDGSEVLGLGKAGPLAALPVLESKALLFKEFADVNAFPLPIAVDNDDEFVAAVKALAPAFGAIHLEDIEAPRCFALEKRVADAVDIAVMHNDQHGTAIAVLAALINALRIVDKQAQDLRVVINGSGAAGVATARLLARFGVGDLVLCNENGVLSEADASAIGRVDGEIADFVRGTNPRGQRGNLREAIQGADVLIGFGRRKVLEVDDIRAMKPRSIVFVMAYPNPEIEAMSILNVAGVVASGRSDFPNQINNMLCFPGFFRGLLDARAARVTDGMKMAAAHAIADVIGRDELHEDYFIPSVFDRRVARAVAAAVVAASRISAARPCAEP